MFADNPPTFGVSVGTVMCTPSSAILPTTMLGMVIMSEQSSSFLFRRGNKNYARRKVSGSKAQRR